MYETIDINNYMQKTQIYQKNSKGPSIVIHANDVLPRVRFMYGRIDIKIYMWKT